MFKIINTIIFCSFPYFSNKETSFDRAMKWSHQKLNIFFIIAFLVIDNKTSGTIVTQMTFNSKQIIPENQKVQNQKLTHQYHSSIIDEVNSATDRSSITHKNDQYEEYFILDLIQEGITIVKADQVDEAGNIQFKVEYQNQMNRAMFQHGNEDLLNLFSDMSCEILQDYSPMMNRNSVLSSQSFAQKQFKQMKRSSKFNPASYFIQDFKNNEQRQRNQSLCPSPRSQVTTVLKSLVYLINTRKFRFEVNGRAEALIIEATYEKEHQETRQIEFILTIRNENTIIMVSRDVVHRKNIKTLLQINQSKSKTLSFVSHEFRSPLNVIINILSQLKSELKKDSDFEQSISIIIENANYMLNLSNDLLDFAQMKGDSFSLRRVDFEIHNLAEECLKMFELQAKQKGIKLLIKSNAKYIYLNSDRNRLKQILINLLANALKFTTQGSVAIKIQQTNLNIDIGVSDTGIGIREEDQRILFSAFGKIKNFEHDKLNQQGVGLGLLISNKIAQQLTFDGSGLKIISRYGDHIDRGSFFYLTLAIKEFHKKIQSIKLSNVSINHEVPINERDLDRETQFSFYKQDIAVSFNGLSWIQEQQFCNHILIVDDNVFNLNILQTLIQKLTQCDIDKSNNGQEAIDYVRKKKCCQGCSGYKAIFMDMEMPQINGLQASALILKEKPNIKIFIVSGYEEKELINEGLQIGVKEFIVKPISKERLQKIFLEYQL